MSGDSPITIASGSRRTTPITEPTAASPSPPSAAAAHDALGQARIPWQALVEWGLLATGVLIYVALPHIIDGDAGVRYDALTRLVDHGQLTSMRYSIVQEIASIPLYLLGMLRQRAFAFVERFNMLVFFGGLVILYSLLRQHLDADVLRRFLLLLVAGSMFPYHTTNYYGEIFTAIAVATGLALTARHRLIAGMTTAVIGVVNSPATVGGLCLVAARKARQTKHWLRWAVPVAAALVLTALEAWLRRGSPFRSGYEGNAGARTVLPYSARPGFSYPIVLGVLSELLSFGKGIAFFAPGLLLIFAKRDRFTAIAEDFYRSCGLFLCGLVLVYAKWWSWYGGWYWGPRFLLFAGFPASLLLAYHLSTTKDRQSVRVLVLGLLFLSVWVAASGAVFRQDGQGICQQNNYALESLCWYVPEFSPLILPFIHHRPLPLQDRLTLAYFAVVGVCLAVPTLRRLWTDVGPLDLIGAHWRGRRHAAQA
jgi:hypothetical protein